ncbi:MAG: type VI secretion system contractile sheath large subunit [Pseudomonadales bacterium]|uniref:Type VI secretion system protein n=1 Tax=Oleiphilus messinensis TaxID=141451 RepID=A0A1Y0IEF7_9GAMM|nr:type VI secretion system contractile sheath large subunit [Oleiphilus messinensis]ARU58821.1 type VI secretion system protein [Oleiphilus messinensis]MCG8613638.1 type VI secretion system contractile sheath large subunit [Pseudomonadales bacterium]
MSEQELQGQEAGQETESLSLLDQAIGATRQTEPDAAKDLISNLAQQVMSGTVTWDRNLTQTVNKAVAKIDEMISSQLAEIMHSEKFQKLEGSWRGLNHLVMNSETSTTLKIRMLNIGKRELFKDLDKAVEFDQSQIFKKIYEAEYGTAGGEPYGCLIGDYEFTNHPEDIDLLNNMSGVAASGFCPFISAAGAQMFGFDDFTELSNPRDLEKIFDSAEYIKWRSFRDSEDSRFTTLVMPRVLSRLPYGDNSKPVEEFRYEEFPLDETGKAVTVDHTQYAWMNAAYVMGTTLTKAFAENGWCTAIRGAEGGGKVEGLPTHLFRSDDGDLDQKCPAEIGITERREAELSKLGFLPLCHYKNTDYAVFFGAQTAQKAKKYDEPSATANAAISARLPYIMATSRIAHYLKVMARDKIGSFMEAQDAERWLNRWINGYTNSNPDASPEMKAKFPLAEARIQVKENPEAPGSYSAIAHLRPWLQMEELTASLRMVAEIPKSS